MLWLLGDNQSVMSSAPVVSRCFPGGYNVKLYISRGRLAWWLLAFLHSDRELDYYVNMDNTQRGEVLNKTQLIQRFSKVRLHRFSNISQAFHSIRYAGIKDHQIVH